MDFVLLLNSQKMQHISDITMVRQSSRDEVSRLLTYLISGEQFSKIIVTISSESENTDSY